MFKSIKLAIRNLRRSGVYAVINIGGLAISLAIGVFIILWVQDERSYDRFHREAENIYMAVAHFRIEETSMDAQVSSGLFAPTAKDNFASVENYCRLAKWDAGYAKYDEVKSSGISCYYADPNFFDFFNFPILKGNSGAPLHNPNDVVINERLARQLFGNDDPVGKIAALDNGRQIRVTAVMKDMPKNTFLQNVDLVSTFAIDSASYYNRILSSWDGCEFLSFLRLRTGTDAVQLAKQVTEKQTVMQGIRSFSLQPMVKLHLYNIMGEPAGIKAVRLFQWIAFVILVIACINYVNLVTARATKRQREIGLKKIVGAGKIGLFMQLISEAVIMFAISIVLALILNFCLLGAYNQLSGKELSIGLFDGNIWLTYFVMLFAVIILAGIYPAYMIASFNPKNFLQSIKTKTGNIVFRRILVVTQFTASTVLIIGTITLLTQMNYIRKKDIGYDRENVMMCRMGNIHEHFDVVKAELEKQTSILGVTAASENIMRVGSGHGFSNWEGKPSEGLSMHTQLRVDTSFLRIMRLTMVDGPGFTSTISAKRQYILNEAAVKAMGITNPVGKWVEMPEWKIVGVVKDFNFKSLHNEVEPLAMFNEPRYVWMIYVRIAPGKTKNAIAAVENLWNQYNPEHPFDYWFLDDTFNNIYKSDIRTGRLFGVFSIIAVLISCLGLFGLIVFTAELKRKEIGIRKVLGASISDIVKLLVKEFLLLVGISILVAFPLAYYWSGNLLQDFAEPYRISINWWIFAAAMLITVTLTLITVSVQAIRAAITDPVKAIKTE